MLVEYGVDAGAMKSGVASHTLLENEALRHPLEFLHGLDERVCDGWRCGESDNEWKEGSAARPSARHRFSKRGAVSLHMF